MTKSEEINTKIARVVNLVAAKNLGGVLVSSQPNFSWLSAGGTNGIDLSREAGAGALLVRHDGKCFVLASRIEMTRLLSEELAGKDFEPVEFSWEEEKALPTFLAERARRLLSNGAMLGSDIAIGSEVMLVEPELARCRYELTSSEIERLRLISGDAAHAVEKLARSLAPGETEREIARRVSNALAAHDLHPVVNLIAADERIQKYRHPVPTDCRWKNILMIAVCARRGGLIASFTRIVASGTLPDELRRRTLAAARVNAELVAATLPGASGADLYRLAARTYAAEGFEHEERLHHQGGATGYRTRDWLAHPASTDRVQVSQAFAWNPSVTGTKVEDTGIAFADGLEVLTRTTDWPQISVRLGDREYLSPDILVL